MLPNFIMLFSWQRPWGKRPETTFISVDLTDEVLKHFRIGLAPPERNYLYQRLTGQYRDEDFLDSGLFYLSDANQFVDTFHNRIMFPLTNDQGKVIAFSGRIWQKTDSQTSKYKNSRSTAIF